MFIVSHIAVRDFPEFQPRFWISYLNHIKFSTQIGRFRRPFFVCLALFDVHGRHADKITLGCDSRQRQDAWHYGLQLGFFLKRICYLMSWSRKLFIKFELDSSKFPFHSFARYRQSATIDVNITMFMYL
jgi:hypothetical protein